VGAMVIAIVLIADVRGAIGFSSFAVLTYYGIANASALTLPASERTYPNIVAIGGLVGCAVLAFSLPLPTVGAGIAVMAIGAVSFAATRGRRRASGSAMNKDGESDGSSGPK
jgi:APA family basic amino acid/polyamine antiporter